MFKHLEYYLQLDPWPSRRADDRVQTDHKERFQLGME